MTGNKRKNPRTSKTSRQKSSKFIKNQNKDCLRKTKCDLNEENSSIEEERPSYEDETYFDPFRVKTRCLIANISSYVATMEINIFHNWSCIAPEPQDIFGMLEGAEKLSCFLEEKFYAMQDNEVIQVEVENIKYIYCRSKIVIYIIKNILGRLGDIDNDLTYEMIVINEVNRHLHLIKRFGLKLPMDCSILKIKKNKLSFSDFVVMIESDLGTFSLKQTEQVKGILKRPAGILGEICKASFPLSFLEEENLKSYETQFSRETNNFEETQISGCEALNIQENKRKRKFSETISTSSTKKLSIGNNPDESSFGSEITSFPGTPLLIPVNSDNHLEKKERRYSKKYKETRIRKCKAVNIQENESKRNLRRATISTSSSKKLNIGNNPEESALDIEITSFPEASLLVPANSDNRLGKKKRVYNKKHKDKTQISEFKALNIQENNMKRKLRSNNKDVLTATISTSSSKKLNIGNNPEESALDIEITNFPEASLFVPANSDNHLGKKKRVYYKRHKATISTSSSKKLNIGNNPEESALDSEITSFPETSLLVPANSDNHLGKKKRVFNKRLKATTFTASFKKMNIENNPDKSSSLDSEVTNFPGSSLLIPANSENNMEKKKRVYNKKSKERTKPTSVNEAEEVMIPSNVLINEIDDERTKPTNVNETCEALIPSTVLINEIDEDKKESISVCTFSEVSAPSNDEVKQEEIEYGGEVTISSYDVYQEETEYPERTKPTNVNETCEVLISSTVLMNEIDEDKKESFSVHTFSEVSVPSNDDVKQEEIEYGVHNCGVSGITEDQTSLKCVSSSVLQDIEVDGCYEMGPDVKVENKKKRKMNVKNTKLEESLKMNIKERTGLGRKKELIRQSRECSHLSIQHFLEEDFNLSLLRTILKEDTKFREVNVKLNNQEKNTKRKLKGTSLLIPATLDNNVVKKKRPYNKKQKVDGCYEMGPDVKVENKKKGKMNVKNTKLEGLSLPIQCLKSEQRVKDKTVINISQVDNTEEKYKKSEITIPATKNIKSYFTMDLKTLNNEEKFINITEDLLLKKDTGYIHQNNELHVEEENKLDQDIQPLGLGYDINAVDLMKVINPELVKTSGVYSDIEMEFPCKTLEEAVKTEKTNHYLSKGFTADTLEKIVKVIDDPSYEGNDLKKTLSGIINQSRRSHVQYFHSSENSVIPDHNYIKIHSIGNELNLNPDYDCESAFHNEILDRTNYSPIKNTTSNFCLNNKNINDKNNNARDNKLSNHSSSHLTDSLDSNSIKMNTNAVETTTEELMNTEQFLQNSIDINYSQNIMPSEVSENDLNSVSLAKIRKRQNFKGNKVTNAAKSLDLDFSDLYWA